MFRKIKNRSEFSNNVITLMTGSTLSYIVPILVSPILTRIYTPNDFGLYAIFLAIISIISSITGGRYELAIMLPENDDESANIVLLCMLINSFITVLIFILLLLFDDAIFLLLNIEISKLWLYLIPTAVFISGCYNILVYFNNRFKEYKNISNTLIIRSSSSAFIQLLSGLIKLEALGLVIGQVISQTISTVKLSFIAIRKRNLFYNVNKVKLIYLARRYNRFPRYSVPAILSNKLSFQLTNIIISSIFSITTLGFYTHVQRVLGLPSTLIGSSIGRVFFHESNKEKQKTGKSIKTLKFTLLKLFWIGIIIFGFLFFIIKDLFAFVFGEEWSIAGEYAKITIPFFFIQFIVSSISSIDTVMEKQKYDLLFNLAILATSIIILFFLPNQSFETFLYIYTIGLSIVYSIYGYLLIKMSNGDM